MDDISDSNIDQDQSSKKGSDAEKNYKYGIIYLSYIPTGLNVKLLTEIMSPFGEVGRIYLEPDAGNKKHRTYIEGWIEFKKKRVAKLVAETLNGTPLQHGRKHNKLNGQIWNIKYLHRFKWAHLTDQLAHARAEREQRRKFEMSHARKQVDFYQKMIEQSKRSKHKKIDSNRDDKPMKSVKTRQKIPVGHGKELSVPAGEDLLSCIFKKVD